MGKYFRVKNFGRFQHYKKRNPPWIRLYNSIIDNYELSCLQDASKWHLVALWLLASRCDNKIPYDDKWIATRIQAKSRVNLKELASLGFIEELDDSDSPADRYQDDLPENRAEDRADNSETEAEDRDRYKNQIEEIFSCWQEQLNHPRSILDKVREKAIRERLKEGLTVERIKEAILGIKKSDHHMGRGPKSDGAVYDDIELICRSGKNVDRFADMNQGSKDPKLKKNLEGIAEAQRRRDERRGVQQGDGLPDDSVA